MKKLHNVLHCKLLYIKMSLISSFPFFFLQAQRARSMGAIVYCVGVKEFNQTQVASSTEGY